jgi:hypothetical protein
MTACPRKFGPYAVCGVALEMTTVDGRLLVTCPACERLRRGICLECSRPVDGKVGAARRCRAHKKAAELAESARYRERNREEYNDRQRLYMRQPDVRARNITNLRDWRRANPDKVKAQRFREELRAYQQLRGMA